MSSAPDLSQVAVVSDAYGPNPQQAHVHAPTAPERTGATHIAWVLGFYLTAVCLVHGAFVYSNNPGLRRAVFAWFALQPPAIGSARASLLFVLAAVSMLAGYAILLQRSPVAWCERRPHGSAVLLVSLVLPFVSLVPFLSTDVLSYYQQGWVIAEKGASPYHTPPGSFSPFPGIQFMKGQNHTVLSPYGPLWSHLEAAVYRMTAGNLWGGVMLYKLLGAASVLWLAWTVWAMLRRAEPQIAMRGALFVGANPLLLIEGPGMAHNDLAALAVAFAGLALLHRGGEKRIIAGLVLIGVAMLIKALVAVVPFCLAVYWLRSLGFARTLTLALKALLLWLPVALAFGYGFVRQWADVPLLVGAANANLPYEIRYTPVNALKEAIVNYSLARGVPVEPGTVKLALLALAFAAALAMTLLLLARARSLLDAVKTMGPAYMAATVAASYWRQWYAIWPVPFAALGRERLWHAAAIAYSAGALLTYPITHTAGIFIR